jgi:hypothetical protein
MYNVSFINKKELNMVRRKLKQETLDPFSKRSKLEEPARGSYPIPIHGEIPYDISDGVYFSITRNKSNGVHSLGNPQPAKFIPEIPRWAIRKFSRKGETVLDPFVGSGTTMTEARLLGRNSYGIDHNPLARLISKVKSTPLKYELLTTQKKKLETAMYNNIGLKDIDLPAFRNRDFWFDRSASEGIALIRMSIEETVENNEMKDFFTVVLSEVIQKVSKVGSGQILPAKRSKKEEKHPEVTREDVYRCFLEQLKTDIVHIREFSFKADKKASAHIVGDDARKMAIPGEVNLIVTSPPYINSHHYIWTNKLRLLQLNMVDDKKRLELMRQEIGTEEFSTREYNQLEKTGIEELDEKISLIYYGDRYKASGNQNRIRARSVYQYFCDMKIHMAEAYKILPKNSHYILVVGDNKICKVQIPTADFLTVIAKEIGFDKVAQFQILLKNRTLNLPRNVPWADMTLFDRILVLKKT